MACMPLSWSRWTLFCFRHVPLCDTFFLPFPSSPSSRPSRPWKGGISATGLLGEASNHQQEKLREGLMGDCMVPACDGIDRRLFVKDRRRGGRNVEKERSQSTRSRRARASSRLWPVTGFRPRPPTSSFRAVRGRTWPYAAEDQTVIASDIRVSCRRYESQTGASQDLRRTEASAMAKVKRDHDTVDASCLRESSTQSQTLVDHV